MDVYETMWKEFKSRIALAKEYSIRQDLSIQDVINLIVAYENHFAEELKEAENEKVKEDTGLDPL